VLQEGISLSRARKSPREGILSLIVREKELTRTKLASALGISYWSARYWLDKISAEGFIRKEVKILIKPNVRRVFYYPVVAVRYYRTQFALMFYTEKPRTKTPDPIAEFRVTVVSNLPGKYNIQEFERACIYIGVILAPQTYWIKQQYKITANELDELIDTDELIFSVPVHKKLNYAERYAVFFRSRQGTGMWRNEYIGWWLVPTEPLPLPRIGDYEYDEGRIKEIEEKRIQLLALKMRFNNERGEMESITI
jgi:hypothetical protein